MLLNDNSAHLIRLWISVLQMGFLYLYVRRTPVNTYLYVCMYIHYTYIRKYIYIVIVYMSYRDIHLLISIFYSKTKDISVEELKIIGSLTVYDKAIEL